MPQEGNGGPQRRWSDNGMNQSGGQVGNGVPHKSQEEEFNKNKTVIVKVTRKHDKLIELAFPSQAG